MGNHLLAVSVCFAVDFGNFKSFKMLDCNYWKLYFSCRYYILIAFETLNVETGRMQFSNIVSGSVLQ